jgi:hypothetical protein
MPNNRLLKNKRTPEEIELLKQSLQPRSRRGRRKPIIPIIALRASKRFQISLEFTLGRDEYS